MNKKSQAQHFLERSLIGVLKYKPMYFMLLLSTVIISAIANVWPSLILKKMVDGPLTTGVGSVWNMAFMYLVAVLTIGVLDFGREISSTVIGQGILLETRKQMLEHLQKLPMKYYLRVPVGETLSKFSADLDAISTLFSAGLVSAMADSLKIIGLFIVLFALSKPIGWIALGAIPIIFFLSNFFRKNIFIKQKEVRKRVSDINATIQEVYSGLKIIKTFGKEDLFSKRFEERLEVHRLAMNGNSIYDAWFPCIMQIVRASVIALAMVIGASNNGTTLALGLSIGTLAAIADLFVRMFEPVEAIASEVQTIQQAFAGIDRIKDFFLEKTEDKQDVVSEKVSHLDKTTKKDIIMEQVDFEYTEGKKVIHQATVTIKEGSKVAFAGRTGSGKTTLLSLIAGLYPVANGSISIGGSDPFLLPASERRKIIGIVPQNVQLFNGSILDNITLKDDEVTKEDVWMALETVGLSTTVNDLKDGLYTIIGEGEAQLSFGQMQLLSLARAIVTNPPILLLDELTSGLDALTERKLLNAIREVSSNRTIITISHRISGIIDADIVHIMDAGRVVESGSPEELSQKEGWFAVYKRLEERGWKVG